MKVAWLKLKAAIVALLRQGMTPRKLAVGLALGTSVSICPVLGVPTPLLTVLALWLRINLPLVQAINYLATPLQWLLIVPFIRVGETLTGADPLPLLPAEIVARARAEPMLFFKEFGGAVWHAALAWLVLGPFLFLAVYALARPLLVRAARRRSPEISPTGSRE